MQDTKDISHHLPIVLPDMGASATSALLPQTEAGRTEVQGNDDGMTLRRDGQQLGADNLPDKNLVDALIIPSTIGTAIAAGALFTIKFAGWPMQDISEEAGKFQWEMHLYLGLSAYLYSIATAITICLEALYGSPSFCKILYKKLNQNPELRTKFEPWPSWDFLRYFVAYAAVASAFLCVILHLTATMIIFRLFGFMGHPLIGPLTFSLPFFGGVLGWTISIVLESQSA